MRGFATFLVLLVDLLVAVLKGALFLVLGTAFTSLSSSLMVFRGGPVFRFATCLVVARTVERLCSFATVPFCVDVSSTSTMGELSDAVPGLATRSDGDSTTMSACASFPLSPIALDHLSLLNSRSSSVSLRFLMTTDIARLLDCCDDMVERVESVEEEEETEFLETLGSLLEAVDTLSVVRIFEGDGFLRLTTSFGLKAVDTLPLIDFSDVSSWELRASMGLEATTNPLVGCVTRGDDSLTPPTSTDLASVGASLIATFAAVVGSLGLSSVSGLERITPLFRAEFDALRLEGSPFGVPAPLNKASISSKSTERAGDTSGFLFECPFMALTIVGVERVVAEVVLLRTYRESDKYR